MFLKGLSVSYHDVQIRVALVRFGYGLGVETVRAVPVFGSGGSSAKGVCCVLQKGFSAFKYTLTGKDGSGSPVSVPGKRFQSPACVWLPWLCRKRFRRFRFRFQFRGKTVPTSLPVSGSGSVLEPPWPPWMLQGRPKGPSRTKKYYGE